MRSQTEIFLLKTLNRLLPDSNLKTGLKHFRRTSDYWRFGYRLDSDGESEVLTITRGPLAGNALRFPNGVSRLVLSILSDAPSYFQQDIIHKGDSVIDAGAYPGDWTVLASRIVGTKGIIFAFEPDPSNFEWMEHTLELNRVKNAKLFPYALGGETRSIDLIPYGEGSALKEYFFEDTINHPAPIPVEAITIDEFVKQSLGSSKLDAIKMDIEGAEIAAVNGGRNTLSRDYPNLTIASYHPIRPGATETTQRPLEKLLKDIGYEYVETLYPKHPTTFALGHTSKS